MTRFRIPGRRLALAACGCGVCLFLLAPVVVIVVISFSDSRYLDFPPRRYSLRWYRALSDDPSWRESFVVSAQVAILTASLATPLGTAAAVGLARGSFRGRRAILAAFLSPIVVPGIVTAVAAYFYFSALGLVGSRAALVLVHTALAIPLVVLTVSASLAGVSRSVETAARTLGAGPWETFYRVTLPLIRPGVAVGAIFAFITSFDEPVVALFLSGSRSVTLPKRMWDGIRYEIDPTVAAVSTFIIALSVLAVVATEMLRPASPTEPQR